MQTLLVLNPLSVSDIRYP